MKNTLNRRSFLSQSATAAAGLLILPSSRMAFAYDANSKLNIAGIGVGGQGRGSLDAFASMGNNLVAFCDVDSKRAGDIYQKHPGAKRYQDFRKMFDEMEKQIDAVLIATPDHTHAVAAVMAMKLGKHVYCEKLLTRTVHEARGGHDDFPRAVYAHCGHEPDARRQDAARVTQFAARDSELPRVDLRPAARSH